MVPDIAHLVAATVATLAPYLPYLLNIGVTGGNKLVEVIAEKGGELAWSKAQTTWSRIMTHFGNDAEITSAATMVATKPTDEGRQILLAEVLAARLSADPTIAQELLNAIGSEAIQQVISEQSSIVQKVTQQLHGNGTQTVRASGDSSISDVQQSKY